MANVLLIVLLIISVILTGLILIQQSEGGALGIGGGGGGGGFMSGRSAANSVSRMTAILGTLFLIVSLGLSVVMTETADPRDLIKEAEETDNFQNGLENPALTAEDPLTNESDSGETTIPSEGGVDTTESGTDPEAETGNAPEQSDDEPEDE